MALENRRDGLALGDQADDRADGDPHPTDAGAAPILAGSKVIRSKAAVSGYRKLFPSASLESFIEQVYNRQRLHSALAYQAPATFEAITRSPGAAAQQPLATTPTDCPQFHVSA